VPEAFALTARAFRDYCAANGIRVAGAPPARVAERIRTGTFPAALRAELLERLAALPGPAFAVRSSALSEDGAACSMAGQLETLLDVPRAEVADSVKACWAALFGPAVQAYAVGHRLALSTAMGVIVQRQVHPRYAGVLFTIDPVTGSADQFVIEWVEGLGDALVSGATTPGRIRVSRRHPVAPAGLPPDFAPIVSQLAAQASLVERQIGCPVDVEWCVEGARVFLLQARPVTALLARDAVVWTSTNMSENFPKPLTPFAWSVVDEFYTRYLRSLARMLGVRDPSLERRHSPLHRLTGVQGGRIYYNIKSWYGLLESYVPGGGRALRRGLDHYIGQEVPIPLDRADGAARARRPGLLSRVVFWPRLAFRLSRGRRCLARFERMFLAYRQALRREALDAPGAGALMERLDALFEDFVARHWHRQCIADLSALVFPGLLHALVERDGGTAAAAVSARLLRQPGTSGTEAARIIARMAAQIGARDDLVALLASGRHAELRAALPAPLQALYADFMERFGARCYHECLIVSPTFEERPELFWDLVDKYRRAELTADARRTGGRGPDPADEVLRGLPWGRRLAVRLVLSRARRAIALREQGRLVQSLLFGEVRRLALALGTRLVRLGHLGTAEDVFYLHTGELRDLCAGKLLFPETLPELIASRRRALARCEERETPECFVLPEGANYRAADSGGAAAEGAVLHGVGASSGRARGTARVVLDPARDGLEPGEILVARSTDPGWTALFAIAGALVLERGGILSHGAIVAREFGVPAVVGVEGVTRRLRGGEQLSVDGDAGEVAILETADRDTPRADGPRRQAEDERGPARDRWVA
jgi:pyruvate,water dikinase